ncbi:Triacylglycerol lipase [Bertholletia excelsa]
MAYDRSFSKNYMLLSLEEAGLLDAIRLLFYGDLEKTKFIDCPKCVKDSSFKYRWLIFVSITVQKGLQLVAKPLAWFGSVLEWWINLVSSNQNFAVLLWNFLRGWEGVNPDRESATFLSFTGSLDRRVDLDKNIKHGDNRYYAALSAMAAKASYENRAYLQTTVTDNWKYQSKRTTQAFMLRDKNVHPELIVVAFRGTEAFDADAWCTDFDISWYELEGMGKVHGGFTKALGLQKHTGWPKDVPRPDNERAVAYYAIRERLGLLLQENEQARFILTGHSLGGALAILFPAVLAFHGEEWLLERLAGVYTFGQPRVGDEKFGEFMKAQLTKFNIPYYRFVYCNDLVPRLPYDDSTLMFKHFGTCLYFNSFYKGKVVEEEPNKNYFSPLSGITKIINATWELIRSFTISYTKGPDYKEGFVLLGLRLFGLVAAGVPAHSPQDYVNVTRLVSPDLYLPVHDPNHQQSITC